MLSPVMIRSPSGRDRLIKQHRLWQSCCLDRRQPLSCRHKCRVDDPGSALA